MNISPLDIRQKQFKLKFRGFDIEEVDSFLEEVTETFESLIKENESLREHDAALEAELKAYRESERGLRDALMSAQKMSEDMKAVAEKEAMLKVKEAELESERMLRAARAELAKMHEEIAELKRLRERFALKVRGIIEDHLKMLSYEERQLGEKVE